MSHGYRCRHWKPLPDFGLLQACSVNFGNILQLLIFSPQAHDSANFAGKLCEGARALDSLWSGYDLLCIYCLELKLPGPANLQRSYLFLPQHQSPRPSGRSDFLGYPFWQPGTQKHSHTPLADTLTFHIIKHSFQSLPCHNLFEDSQAWLTTRYPWCRLGVGVGRLQVHILTAQSYGDAHGSCDSCSSSQCDVTRPAVQVPLVCFPPTTNQTMFLIIRLQYLVLFFS